MPYLNSLGLVPTLGLPIDIAGSYVLLLGTLVLLYCRVQLLSRGESDKHCHSAALLQGVTAHVSRLKTIYLSR
jgi:hypothetical protein